MRTMQVYCGSKEAGECHVLQMKLRYGWCALVLQQVQPARNNWNKKQLQNAHDAGLLQEILQVYARYGELVH